MSSPKLKTAEKYYGDLIKYPPLKSGDKYLDKILGGGFLKSVVHLLIGGKKKNSNILLQSTVRSMRPQSEGGLGIQKVAYIDGNNRFNPYLISQTALSLNMNPRKVLSKIYVARAFNWSQMVEIAEVKLAKLTGVGLVCISGITSMFEASENGKEGLNQKSFKDLKLAINGIKKAMERNQDPIVIITAPKHEKSLHKPVGGKIMTHFGCIIVEIIEKERYTDYILAQHPFMPQNRVIKWKSVSDQITDKYTRWLPEGQKTGDASKPDQEPTGKKWKKTIELPRSNGYLKEVSNMRLKEKRNNTNKRMNRNKSQNLTLDYYIKKSY